MTHELLRSLSQRGVEVASLSEDIFDGIADTVTPKGMIAVAKKPHRPLEGRRMRGESKSCFLNSDALLVLDRIQDPGNVGTIIRTADAIGIGGVVCVKGTADPFSPKGVRAAAGALFRIPVHELGEPGDALDKLRLSGYRIAAVDANAIAPCWGTDLSGRVALVMGNEGSGLSSCFVDAVDIAIHIPMEEGAESLNVAVAAAIVAYERYRQIADLKGFGE
jgi:TrmH family RNA methyltransferase